MEANASFADITVPLAWTMWDVRAVRKIIISQIIELVFTVHLRVWCVQAQMYVLIAMDLTIFRTHLAITAVWDAQIAQMQPLASLAPNRITG
jgi:hypothetical protein